MLPSIQCKVITVCRCKQITSKSFSLCLYCKYLVKLYHMPYFMLLRFNTSNVNSEMGKSRVILWMFSTRFYISCNYSCKLYFLEKISLVKLKKPLYFTILESKLWYNQTVIKMPGFIKTCDQYLYKFKFGHFFSSPVKLYQRIWIWNLDQNLMLALLIMAVCAVLFRKL